MLKPEIIGGLFGLPELAGGGCRPPFLTDDSACFVNARSALGVLLDVLKPQCVWLPSYLCGSILSPLEAAGVSRRFFEVDRDLQARPGPWLDEVAEGDLALLIAYFGFPIHQEIAEQVRSRKALVVEDATQALLSETVGQHADFVIYSPRKWVGVPDGGVLRARAQVLSVDLEPPPHEWWMKVFQACLSRRDSDVYGADPNREWFRLFREASASMPCGPYAMSTLSRSLLETAFDYRRIAARRRENFSCLLEGLADIALYKELPDGVVPLGFPVRIAERSRVQAGLFQAGIYPQVLWELGSIVPARYRESHELSAKILMLICDQRYDCSDMRRTIGCIRG